MDEELRNRYKAERRDYSLPRKPVSPPAKELQGFTPEKPARSEKPAAPEQPAAPQKPIRKRRFDKKPRRRFPRKRWLVAIFGLLIVAGGAWLITNHLTSSGPIPRSIAGQLKFQPYYPKTLPSSYIVDAASFKIESGGAMVFNIDGPDGLVMPLSEQAEPKGFNIASSSGSIQFYTQVGPGSVFLFNKTTRVCEILAGKTLIILTINGVSSTNAQSIARSFVAQ